jgi:hypothetical protein
VFGVIVSVLLSIVYAVARGVLGHVVLRGRSRGAKDVELPVLRREVTVLRRQDPEMRRGERAADHPPAGLSLALSHG